MSLILKDYGEVETFRLLQLSHVVCLFGLVNCQTVWQASRRIVGTFSGPRGQNSWLAEQAKTIARYFHKIIRAFIFVQIAALLKKCFACFPTDRRMLWASTDWVKTASIGWYGMFGWLDEIFVTGRAFNTFQPLKMDKTETTKSLDETEESVHLMGSWICPKNTKTY